MFEQQPLEKLIEKKYTLNYKLIFFVIILSGIFGALIFHGANKLINGDTDSLKGVPAVIPQNQITVDYLKDRFKLKPSLAYDVKEDLTNEDNYSTNRKPIKDSDQIVRVPVDLNANTKENQAILEKLKNEGYTISYVDPNKTKGDTYVLTDRNNPSATIKISKNGQEYVPVKQANIVYDRPYEVGPVITNKSANILIGISPNKNTSIKLMVGKQFEDKSTVYGAGITWRFGAPKTAKD